jgi:hypothetical protein
LGPAGLSVNHFSKLPTELVSQIGGHLGLDDLQAFAQSERHHGPSVRRRDSTGHGYANALQLVKEDIDYGLNDSRDSPLTDAQFDQLSEAANRQALTYGQKLSVVDNEPFVAVAALDLDHILPWVSMVLSWPVMPT